MPAFVWALLLKPFALLALTLCVLWPIRRLVERKMGEGKLKRLLLRRIS